jgi:hypothetical protein
MSGGVMRQDAELTLASGQDHGVDLVRVGQPLRRTMSSWRGTLGRQLRRVLADVVDRAGQEERLLREVVDLAVEDLLEARDVSLIET